MILQVCDKCRNQSVAFIPILNAQGQPSKILCPACLRDYINSARREKEVEE